MHFIADLFRTRQEVASLLGPPFSPEQTIAIKANRRPRTPLARPAAAGAWLSRRFGPTAARVGIAALGQSWWKRPSSTRSRTAFIWRWVYSPSSFPHRSGPSLSRMSAVVCGTADITATTASM